MSIVGVVKCEGQEGFYGGPRKRPLSIIEENDGDEGDPTVTPPKENDVNPAPEIHTKEITIETTVSSTATTKSVAKSSAAAMKNDTKKKPPNIDTTRARSQTSCSKSKSPKSKSPLIPETKTSSKILNFSKNVRVAPKTDPISKVPPTVAPKPKTPSPSPSKVKSPWFPSQADGRHFAFHKSPTCSQTKSTAPNTKTTEAQTSDDEVAKSMKNLVKRTVSKIENQVASITSSAKQKVKVDPPRRKISKEETLFSKVPFRETENSAATPASSLEVENVAPSSNSAPSSSEKGESTFIPVLVSSREAEKVSKNSIPPGSSDNIENSASTQTSTPSLKETGAVASDPPFTPIPTEVENLTTIQTSTTLSSEAKNSPTAPHFTPVSNETGNDTETQNSQPLTECDALTLVPTLPNNDASKPTTSPPCTFSSIGTESITAIRIPTSESGVNEHASSSNPTFLIEAEKEDDPQTCQSSALEGQKSSPDDTEVENALQNQGEKTTQISTSESSSPEFTTPPTSPPLAHEFKRASNVLFHPILSPRSSHTSSDVPRTTENVTISKSGNILSDGQGLARIREAAESLKLTSSSSLVSKAYPSPPSHRVPFSFRQSPKLSHRPSSEAYSLSSLNNSKNMGPINFNVLSVSSQFSTKGDSGTSDSDNEDKSQNKSGDKTRVAQRSPFLTPKFHPRRGSYFFKRRISSESLASLSENESADNTEELTPISVSDFNQLKETADRLQLSTRRPSVLQWRQQYVESPGTSGFTFRNGMNGDNLDEKLTSERKQKIDEALDWLRNELQEMRSQDQMLARQLLTIRNDIHQLKLRRCTTEHQELLDDVKLELEEQQEFSDVLDIPQPIYEDNPLKHIGVTRLNISARRFSAC